MEQSTAEVRQEETTEPPKQDGTVEGAAQALAGLLGEDGEFPQESGEDAPQGKADSPDAGPAKETRVEPASAEDKPAPAAISLKIGDKEYSIPANDIPEEIRDVVKDGILMRADYTRKTQEVAEQRKAIEMGAQQINAAMQTVQALPQHMAAIQNVEAQLQQFQNPELWQRLESDPLGKIEAKQAYQELMNQRQFLYGKMESDRQNLSAWQAQKANEHVQSELPKVKASIPDFGPEKAKAIVEYAKAQGYGPQQLQAISYSAPLLIAVNKAMEFDKLQSKQSSVAQKVEKLPPKTQKSGVSQGPGTGPTVNQSAVQRLKSSGRVDDAAAVLKSLMG